MKVILTDNHARETVADILHSVTGLSKEDAEQIANEYNEKCDSNYWAIVVEDDYRLSRGMEDLV